MSYDIAMLGPHGALARFDAVSRMPIVSTEYKWSSWTVPIACYVPRRRNWVVITEKEFTELGIPEASRRGRWDTSFTGLVLVDRRCLKRYRRKAGRR